MNKVHGIDNEPAISIGPDRKTALAEALRRRILTMELAPGAVLDETALSAEFGLSRPPVREIMRQMAGEGYIKLELNRAARVTPMSYQSLRHFFILAPMIYVAAIKLAAENASQADIHRLRAIQERFCKALDEDDVQERVFSNDAFHLAIGEIAQNEYLLPSLRRVLIDHSRIGQIYYGSERGTEGQKDLRVSSQQHDEMIEAIARRDAEEAGRLARTHIERARRYMALYVMPAGIEA